MYSKFFLVIAFVFAISLTSALGSNTLCASASNTDISPSSVKVDEEFTVGISIESCGEVIPDFVKFEIIDLSSDISVKEQTSIDVGRLEYSNSKRFLTYHMRMASSATPGAYVIKTRLTYGKGDLSFIKEGSFNVTVTSDEAKLNIASVKMNPVLPKNGDETELTLRIENYGNGNANSVRVRAEHSFLGVKDSFMGTLGHGEDGPAVFTFIPDKSGEFTIPVLISYRDDFGEHSLNREISVVIIKKKSNVGGILLISILFLLAAWFVYYHFKVKKHKDGIIRQLLEKGSSESSGRNQKQKER